MRNRFYPIPPFAHPPNKNQKGWTPTMKPPQKLRTPDHTRSNLGQEKYYRPFMEGYIKLLQTNLNQVKHIGHNYSYTTYTCGENPMIRETLIGNLSGCSGIIVSGPVMIFMWSEISYLRGSAVNWFVNVRCSGMIKTPAAWIGEDVWGWFWWTGRERIGVGLVCYLVCCIRVGACVYCVCQYQTEL